MAQIFHPSTNTISKVTILLGGFVLVGIAWLLGVWYRSAYASGVDVIRDQPIPFSHKHHVGGLSAQTCEWQCMHVSTGGSPANEDVSTLTWQKRQSIPSPPT